MFEKNLSIPVFFHIPKNAGSFVLNRFFVYSLAFNKTKQHLNKRIDILKDGKVSYRLVVIDTHGECDKNKVFDQKTTRNYELNIKDLNKELLDKFYVFSLIICGDGFNSYHSEIYPVLPENRRKHEFITFRESFSRAKSFYFYLRSKNSEHENLHGKFNHVTFDEYLSSYQVEDSWCIRFFTKLDPNKEISEKEFNFVCNLIDSMDVVYYKDIDSYLYRIFKQTYHIDALKHNNIFESREVYDNKNKDKVGLDELDDNVLKVFNQRTYWDQKLFNKYIKRPEENNINKKGKIVNCFYDSSENGIGDFLRGSIYLFNHCSSKDLDFDIDISNHSISKFFKESKKLIDENSIDDFYLKAIPTQNFIHQLKLQTNNALNFTGKGETKYIFTNFHPCLLESNIIKYQNSIPRLNNKCRDFFSKRLEPNNQVKSIISEVFEKHGLNNGEFNVLHFRFNDQESFGSFFNKENLINKYKQAVNICCNFYKKENKPIILLSNSNDFKKYAIEQDKDFLIINHLNSTHTQQNPCGFTGDIEQKEDSLLHTMVDMQICRFANKVESYSAYNHGSGFLYWFCKIHDVPIKLNILKTKEFPGNASHENDYDELIYKYLDLNSGFFVDIGAFDGIKNSKTLLFEAKGWDGLAVEPHPTSFKKLKLNRNCIVENLLVTDKDGECDFFYSEKAPMTSRIDMSGLRKRIHDMDDVLKIKVNCCSPNSLFEKHNINNIDFLKIDAEGHDATIVNSIDFSKVNITLLMYEQWINHDPVGYKTAESNLIKNNFKLVSDNGSNKIWFRT